MKLKARIVELGFTQKQIVEELEKEGIKMACATFNQKIRNVRTLTLEEACVLQKILKIPDEDFKNYFFPKTSLSPVARASKTIDHLLK